MTTTETLPIRSELFIPENKVSVWVSRKEDDVKRDRSKEHQGKWVVEGFTLDEKKIETEIWIFDDNDKIGIDRRVLENNPLQGSWGYAPKVNPRKAELKDMWFYPPKSSKCTIPVEAKEYNHKGTWVKPTFKRNFSQLGSNKAGFINVSGAKKIAKGEKHSVGGRWNMLGFNDDVVRGKKKNLNQDADPRKQRWEIFVRKPSGSQFPISVIAGNKIFQCKTKIFQEKGIPIEEQRLFFKETRLKDEKTLVGSGIANGETIDLGQMMIYVRNHKAKTFTFLVDPDESVEYLKNLVQKREGTPANEQILLFKGEKLVNGKQLLDYCVRHKSTLLLDRLQSEDPPLNDFTLKTFEKEEPDDGPSIHNPVAQPQKPLATSLEKEPEKIEVRTPHGRSFYFDPADDTLKDLKRKVAKTVGLPVKDLYLVDSDDEVVEDDSIMPRGGGVLDVAPLVEVTLPRLTKTKVPLLPNMNFEHVKEIIEKKTGIPKATQRIFFLDGEEKELENKMPVEKAYLEPGSVLSMQPIPLEASQVTVRGPLGRSFCFDFDPVDDSVKEIKARIAGEFGVPVKDLPPILMDEKEVDDDHHPKRGAMFDFQPTMVEVQLPDGKRVKIPTIPVLTIDEVKDAIEEKTGVRKCDQRIFFFDDESEEVNDDVTLAKAKVSTGTPLKVSFPPLGKQPKEIKVKDPSGRVFHMYIDPDEPVKDLKERLANKIQFPIGGFKLDNKQWKEDDDIPLGKAGFLVRSGGILEIEPPEVQIELPNSKKMNLTLLPAMTITDIKDIILKEEELDLSTSDIRARMFFLDGIDDLNDDTPLEKLNFQNTPKIDIRSSSIQVTIENWDGEEIQVWVKSDWYIDDLRQRVSRFTDITPADQHFEFKGQPVHEESKLTTQGIRNGSVLTLRQMSVYIRVPSKNKPICILATPKDTANKIKRRAMRKVKGLNKKKSYCLMSGGKEIRDKEKLRDYNIQHGDLLTLEAFSIRVMNWDGDVFVVDGLNRGDTISSVKGHIFEKEGISIDDQTLLLDGKLLNNAKTLEGERVRHLSILVLEPLHSDVKIPTVAKKTVRKIKPKKFQPTGDCDEIMPVMPDWDRRIFFFDYDDAFDAHIELVVIDWSGEKYELNRILLNMKIKEIKKRIHKLKGVERKKQIIKFDGKILDDKKTLLEAGVGHRSILVLESIFKNKIATPSIERLHGMDIFETIPTKMTTNINLTIQHWNGETFDVRPGPNDYIDDVKDLIHDIKNIPLEELRISFNGNPTVDDLNLGEQNISNGDVLVLEPMRILLELPNEKDPIILKVDLDQKLSNVKKRIAKRSRLPIDSICIIFGGKEIEYSNTIQECRIEHEDILKVEVYELKIMHWSGEIFFVEKATPVDTAYQIKDRIAVLQSIPIDQQTLSFMGKVLNNMLRLKDQGIHHKSVLVLEPVEEVYTPPVKEKLSFSFLKQSRTDLDKKLDVSSAPLSITIQHWNDSTFIVDANPTEYIDDLKETIYSVLDISVDQQRLKFNGKHVSDELTLDEQGIVDNSTLTLEKMKVFLLVEDREEKLEVDVDPEDSIRLLKRRLQNEFKLPIEKYCMLMGGEELTDTRTLSQYDIGDGEVLKLEAFTVKILDWNGEIITVNGAHPNSTVDDLKAQIQRITAVPPSEQLLKVNNKPVIETLRLKDQRIKHGSIVLLDLVSGIPRNFQSPKKTKVSLTVKDCGNSEVSFCEEDGRDETLSTVLTSASESQPSYKKVKKNDKKKKSKSAKAKKIKSTEHNCKETSRQEKDEDQVNRDESQSSGLTSSTSATDSRKSRTSESSHERIKKRGKKEKSSSREKDAEKPTKTKKSGKKKKKTTT